MDGRVVEFLNWDLTAAAASQSITYFMQNILDDILKGRNLQLNCFQTVDRIWLKD